MTVSVVLPVRVDSRRLPEKPFLDIGGKPLLWHVWHNLAGCRAVELVVATDSESVAGAVREWGGTVVLTGNGHRSGTERIAAIADQLSQDRIVNVQADELTFTSADLDRFIAEWWRTEAELLTPTYRLTAPTEVQDVNTVKATVADGRAVGFRRGGGSLPAWGHVGVYGYSKRMLEIYRTLPPSANEITEGLEQLRFIDNGYHFATYDIGHPRFAINTPADLARARERAAGGTE